MSRKQMRIVHIEQRPFHELVYRNVARNREIVNVVLPFLRAEVDALPDGLEGLLVTGDLQGRERETAAVSEARLLGVRLADELELLAEFQMMPSLAATGVILAGDFYAHEILARRGGSGDVRAVWRTFAERCRWVTGVAGNHDLFGDSPSVPDHDEFWRQTNTHFLDFHAIKLDGLKVAGLSGVIGNPQRPFRRSEPDFLAAASLLCEDGPDILILHEGPDFPAHGLEGSPVLREVLEKARPMLVVRGHSYWELPLVALANGTQVLNVDARVVLLVRATQP
jgi:hypothetical protein